MKVIKRAKLHDVAFIAGTNFQKDLDPGKRTGLQILHDEETNVIHARYNGEVATYPMTTVHELIPYDQAPLNALFDGLFKKVNIPQKPSPTSNVSANPKTQAQVSGPHDHVFAGQGAGQTGAGKKIK